MKNITLSADEDLIEAARAEARSRHTTLNEEFRRWLASYIGKDERYSRAMETLDYLQANYTTGGRKFTREEMNARR